MTSVLPEEGLRAARMKQKLLNDIHVKEETRSFLSFSRENLSISQSDIEQGFNKHRFRPNKNTIISMVALLIALLSLGLETWEFHCSSVNAREIQELKRNLESLKHRFLEEDLLDELKAFEEQLYAEESNDDSDSDETDIDNADYDSNYDEDTFSAHDYSTDYHNPPAIGVRPSDFPDSSSTIVPVPSPPEPVPVDSKDVMELLEAVRKVESNHGLQELKRNRKNVDQERRQKEKLLQENFGGQKNSTKIKRDIPSSGNMKNLLGELSEALALKHKRSLDEEDHVSRSLLFNRHTGRNQTRRKLIASGTSFRETLEEGTVKNKENTSAVILSKYPPKKYYTPSPSQPSLHRKDEINVQNDKDRLKFSRRLRKHLHGSRQIFAVHYDGDKYGFSVQDEHTGNGRIRHGDSVFKAWKPSDWVNDLGMGDYFRMASDGSVTVYESGLYLVYAQIHYHDEHAEVGFHLQVNNQPILQCMIDNSCNARNISQTCFSAQLTLLQKEDVLVFKEIGSSRYAIFDKEKSFFGLVKLGEIKRPSH